MPVIDHLFSIGRIRKAIWQLWYPFLTKRLHGEEVLFLNYGYEEEPPMGIPLMHGDEPNRACIQLYHYLATRVDLHGKNVLEVSCGHGGGASYRSYIFEKSSWSCFRAHLLYPTALAFQSETLPVPEPSGVGLLAVGVPSFLMGCRHCNMIRTGQRMC